MVRAAALCFIMGALCTCGPLFCEVSLWQEEAQPRLAALAVRSGMLWEQVRKHR